jgi:hypothetical protein
VAIKKIYVSLAGDDNASGTSDASPVKTLTKVNAMLATASTSDDVYLYFRGGDAFTGTITDTTNSHYSLYITTYNNENAKYATISNITAPTTAVVSLHNKRLVVINNLKVVQVSGSACAGSRGIQVTCTASYSGSNDRTALRMTDCEVTGAEYGIQTQNCQVDLNSVVCKYSWVRGLSIEAQSPSQRGAVASSYLEADRFVFRCADIHIEQVGVSGPPPSQTTNSGNTTPATGLYISGWVFSTATPASGSPSYIYTIKIINCRYGIVVVSPDAGLTPPVGVKLVFKRCFIKNQSLTAGALVTVSKAAGALSGANVVFLDCIFSLPFSDVYEPAALSITGNSLVFWNNTVVVGLATSSKYLLDIQVPSASVQNNIFKCGVSGLMSGGSEKQLRLQAGATISADYNLYAANTSISTAFAVGTTTMSFTGWQTATGADGASSSPQYGGYIPFLASDFSIPEHFKVQTSTVGPNSNILDGGNRLQAIGNYEGSALTDYFGYTRDRVVGYWEKGAVEAWDVNKQNPLRISDSFIKFVSVIGSLPNHGVATTASLAQTPPSMDVHLRPHFIEANVQSTAGVDFIGIWGLGGRAGINGFLTIPTQYLDVLASNFTVPRPSTATPLVRPYSFLPNANGNINEWEIGNTPGLNDDRRVTFTLERRSGLTITNFQVPTLKIKLVNEGETLINLTVTGNPIQPIYNTVIKLKLEIRYTGTRVYNEYTGLLDYQYDFKCYVDGNEVISSPGVVMPQEWIEGVGLQYGSGPAVWAGITGASFSPNVNSIDNMGWGEISSGLDTSFSAQVITSARNKSYLADLDATLNRISNGGFTRYPKQQKAVSVKVKSSPGYLVPQTTAITSVPVHVVLAVQIGYSNNLSGFSTTEYLDRVKNTLTSFVNSLDTESYRNKVIITILGYFGANAVSASPYDDTLGECRILSPRLSTSFTRNIDYFTPFAAGVTAGLSTPTISTSTAALGLRQYSTLQTIISPLRSGTLLTSSSKSKILLDIANIELVGKGSGPYFVGPVSSRCFDSGAIFQISTGFKQIQGVKKLAFFICDNRGPIPMDVMAADKSTIGFSRSKNNNRRFGQIVQADAEFKNIGLSRTGVVVAGNIESPGTPSPSPTYSLRASLRGWTDLLKLKNASGTDSFINTPRSTTSLGTDEYLRSMHTLGLPYNAQNPWLGPFLLNASGLVTPTTYPNLGSFGSQRFPFTTQEEKTAATTQVGVDLAAEVKRWCDVVSAPQPQGLQQDVYDNDIVTAEIDSESGVVFSVAESEEADSLITPWKVYGSEGLFEIIPVDGEVTHYSPDGGNQARITFVSSGLIYLKQKLTDVKPLRGREVSVSFTLRKFNGSATVTTSLVVDGVITKIGSESSAYAGECSRFSYNYKIPVSAKEVSLLFEFSGKVSESAGIAAISLAVGSVSGSRPFTECDSDLQVPSGTVIMTVGTSCPPGFLRVPDTDGKLALGVTDNAAFYERRVSKITSDSTANDPDFRYVDVVLALDMGGSLLFYRAINKMLSALNKWPSNIVRFRIVHTNSIIPNQAEIFTTLTPQTQLSAPPSNGLSQLSLAISKAGDEMTSLPPSLARF